jgi:hypothetical protein
MPAVPPTVHEIVPTGAVAPAIPVTVAVNIKVEFCAPLPDPLRTIVGVVFGITIEITAVAPSEE